MGHRLKQAKHSFYMQYFKLELPCTCEAVQQYKFVVPKPTSKGSQSCPTLTKEAARKRTKETAQKNKKRAARALNRGASAVDGQNAARFRVHKLDRV